MSRCAANHCQAILQLILKCFMKTSIKLLLSFHALWDVKLWETKFLFVLSDHLFPHRLGLDFTSDLFRNLTVSSSVIILAVRVVNFSVILSSVKSFFSISLNELSFVLQLPKKSNTSSVNQ